MYGFYTVDDVYGEKTLKNSLQNRPGRSPGAPWPRLDGPKRRPKGDPKKLKSDQEGPKMRLDAKIGGPRRAHFCSRRVRYVSSIFVSHWMWKNIGFHFWTIFDPKNRSIFVVFLYTFLSFCVSKKKWKHLSSAWLSKSGFKININECSFFKKKQWKHLSSIWLSISSFKININECFRFRDLCEKHEERNTDLYWLSKHFSSAMPSWNVFKTNKVVVIITTLTMIILGIWIMYPRPPVVQFLFLQGFRVYFVHHLLPPLIQQKSWVPPTQMKFITKRGKNIS